MKDTNSELNNLKNNTGLKEVSKQAKELSKMSFGDAFKSTIKVGAIYGILRKGFNTVKDITNANIDMIETTNLFEVQMGKVVDEYGNLDEAQSQYYTKAMAFQDEMNEKLATNKSEMQKYQAMYYGMLNSQLGSSNRDTSYLMSESLTKAGYDIASLYNLNVEDAMNKLKSGLAGQIESLRQIGIDVSEASLTKVLDEVGIDRSVQQLSYAEKEVARYIAIVEQAGQAQGDFARTFEQPANQLRVFKNQMLELKQVASSFFVGLFGQIIPVINGIIMAIKEVLKALGAVFGFEINTGNSSLEEVADTVGDIDGGIGSAAKKAKEFKKQLMGFDEINNITPPNESSGGSGGGTVAGVDSALLNALKEWDNKMDSISGKAQEIRDKMLEWLGFERNDDGTWKLKEGLTNFEKILDVVKTIGVALGTWKVTSSITNLLKNLGILNKSQAFQIAFGVTLTLTGIYAQYKGTQHLLDGDVDLFTILETLLGTTAGAFGIVNLLKSLKIGKFDMTNAPLKNRLEMSLGIMLTIQSIQVITDGIKEGDITKQIVGALEAGASGFFITNSLGGLKLGLKVGLTITLVTVAVELVGYIRKTVSDANDKILSDLEQQMQGLYDGFYDNAKKAINPNYGYTEENYDNYTEYLKSLWNDVKKWEANFNAIGGIMLPKLEPEKIDEVIDKYRELALISAKLFDNGGQSIDNYYNQYKALVDEITGSLNVWKGLYDTYISNNEAVKSANQELDIFLSKLGNSAYKVTSEDIKSLNSTLEEMSSLVKASGDAFVNATVASTDKLKEEGYISKETADLVVANAIRKAEAEGNAFDTYQLKLKDYATQLEKGMISQDEYNKKVAEAKTEYEKATQGADTTKEAVNDLISNMSAKIDLSDWNTAKTYVEKLGGLYTENLTKINENYDAQKKFYDEQIVWTEKALENAKNAYGIESQQYKDIQKELNGLKEARQGVTSQYEDDVTSLKSTVAKSLEIVKEQLINSGYDIEKDAQGLYKAIQDQLNAIGADTEIPNNLKDIENTIDNTGNEINKMFQIVNKSIFEGEERFTNDLTNLYNKKSKEISQNEQDALDTRIVTVANKLAEQTNTIENLTDDQVHAWELLAENSEYIYNDKISQVSEDTRLAIETANNRVEVASPGFVEKWKTMATNNQEEYQKALSVLPENTRLLVQTITNDVASLSPAQIQQWADMAKNSKNEYERNLKGLDTTTSQKIQSCVNAINDKKWTAERTAQSLADAVEKGINTIDTTEAGKQAVAGVTKGINDNKNSWSLWNAIGGVVSNVKNWFKDTLKINSPSKVMASLAGSIPEGVAKGIKDNIEETTKPMKELANNVTNTFTDNIDIPDITKELNQGIKINTKDFAVDTNQYVNYSAIKGQILAQSQISMNDNIAERIAEAVAQSMRNTKVAVNLNAKVQKGIMLETVQQEAREYTMQTGEPAFKY